MLWFKSNPYEKIYTDENIHEAWKHIRSRSKLPGVDGITANNFQTNLLKNLKDIQGKLRARKYAPRPIKQFWISKPDGSKRPLGILTVQDKIVQRAVYQVIEPLFERIFENCSYAFRKGMSVETAITHVKHLVGDGNHWIAHVDIEKYFEHIDIKYLFELIREGLKDEELQTLIRTWLDAESHVVCKKGFFAWKEKRGILQGGILSPLYANIYLNYFDKKVIHAGMKHVRFADNILTVSRCENDARQSFQITQKALQGLKLQVNEKKTVVTHLENGIAFLGKKLTLVKSGKKMWLSVKDNHVSQTTHKVIRFNQRNADKDTLGKPANLYF